jgi:tetratricopeptide (TPR) repeat protein
MTPFELISWSIVIAFVILLVLTIGGMIGLIPFKHEGHLKKLVALLIFEVVGVGFLIYEEGNNKHTQYLIEAKAKHDTAQNMAGEKRYDEALVKLSEILRLNGDNQTFHIKDVFLSRGNILFEREAYIDAITPYSVYTEIVSNDAQALSRYGRVLRHAHRYEEAKSVYERALALTPNDYYILNGLQNCLRRQGGFLLEAERKKAATTYFEQARQYLVSMQKIAETASENKELKKINAELGLARLNWQWKRYPEAIALFEEVTTTYPTHSGAYEDLAAISLEYGQITLNQDLIQISVDLYTKTYQKTLSDKDKIYIGAGLAESIASLDNPSEDQVKLAKNAVLLSIAKNETIKDDPYPFYAAALLFQKTGEKQSAMKYINDAILFEKSRANNPYTFDYVRLVEYEKLKQRWTKDA